METRRTENTNAALLRDVVGAYSANPGAIQIQSEPLGGNRGELLKLRVHKDDHPKVVGGGGKQIQALRVMFQFVGARDQKTLRLVLLEPDRETPYRDGDRPTPELDAEARRRFGSASTDLPANYDPEAVRTLALAVFGRVLALPFEVEIYAAEEKVMLEIMPDNAEQELAEAFVTYAAPIFHAMGKRQGRDLYLEAKPKIQMPR